MARGLVRRDFLRIAALSGTAVPIAMVGMAGPASAESGARGVVGEVEFASPQRLTVRTAQGLVDVVVSAGTRLYSGAYGEVQDAGAFLIGDRVAVEGQFDAGALHAKSIGSIFTPLEARVTAMSQDGSVAESTLGPIALTAGRLPFTPDSLQRRLKGGRVTSGTVISGLGWTHPSTGERYLMVRGA